MTMTRTQIYLTEEQRRQIQHLAEAQHKSMAQVIREAVEEYVVQQVGIEGFGQASVSGLTEPRPEPAKGLAEVSATPPRRADPLRDIIGLGASGITDGSIHHDRDIYDED